MITYTDIAADQMICLQCGSPLIKEETYSCAVCHKDYQQLHGVPLFVSNEEEYIAGMAKQYADFAQQKEKELGELERAFENRPYRQIYWRQLRKALSGNNELIGTLVNMLCERVSPAALLRAKSSPVSAAVLKDFQYLKRDWGWLEEGELQLSEILGPLEEVISEAISDRENILVAGAGVGRIAVELCGYFEKVYATDLSFSMLWFFQQLLKGASINFHEINYTNILQDTYVARELTATYHAPFSGYTLPEVNDKLFCYISDILHSPHRDGSISAFCSAYFTDVLALKLLLPEVKRLLKPGGVFIHLGPLGYGFEDVSEKLAANEIKAAFLRAGFEVVREEVIRCNHLESELSMQTVSLKNWLVVFRKKEYVQQPIVDTTIFGVSEGIKYEVRGRLEEDVPMDQIMIRTADGEAVIIAELAFDILRFLATPQTFEALISYLDTCYEIEAPSMIADVLLHLESLKVINRI